MTTIAYRDGVMAADSRVSGGGIHRGVVDKIIVLDDGSLLGCCGPAGVDVMVAMWLEQGAPPSNMPRVPDGTDFHAILVRPSGDVKVISPSLIIQRLVAQFVATGSGNEIALGAMAMGASAIRAVEIACELDVHSGPPVISRVLGSPA